MSEKDTVTGKSFTIEELEKIVLPALSSEGHSILVFSENKLLMANEKFYMEFNHIDKNQKSADHNLFFNTKNINNLFSLFKKLTAGSTSELSLNIIDGKNGKIPVNFHVSRVENEKCGPLFMCQLSVEQIENVSEPDDVFEVDAETFKIIADKSQNGIILFNAAFDILYANPSAISMWGCENLFDLQNGCFVNSILHEDLAKYDFLIRGNAEKSEIPSEFTIRIIKGNTEIHHLSALTETAFIQGCECRLSSFIDITKQIEAEKALRTSEENYRLHFENVNDVLYSVDRELRITSISPSVEKFTGYKQSELVGKNFTELNLLTPGSLGNAFNDSVKVLSGETIEESEYEFITKDGLILIGSVSGAPLHEDGKITQIVSVARDVTERKKTENTIRRKAEIEGLISQISSDFVNCEIDKVDERVVRAFEILGKFTKLNYCAYAAIDENNALQIKNEWCSEGRGPLHPVLNGVSISDLSFVNKAFSKSLSVTINSIDDLPDDSLAERRIYKVLGLDSCLFMPLVFEGQTLGVIGFGRTGQYKPFSDEVLSILKIVGEVIINAVSRQSAQIKLRESEKTYRLLTEGTSDVIWAADLHLNLTYVSPSVFRLRGFTPDEVYRQKAQEMFTPGSYKKLMEFYRELFSYQNSLERPGHTDPMRSWTGEFEHYKKDGSTVWAELTASFIYNEEEKITGIQGVTRDITERKKADEDIKQREEKYRALFETSPEMITIVGLDGKIFDVNSKVEEFNKLPKKEIVGRPYTEIGNIHEEDLQGAIRQFADILGGKESKPVTYRFFRNDGIMRWVESYTSILTKEGKPDAIQVISRDITFKKEAEEKLRHSGQVFKAAASIASDVMYELDLETLEMQWFGDIDKMLGYEPSGFPRNLEGNNAHIHRDDRQKVFDAVNRSVRDGVPFYEKYRVKKKDGKYIHISSRGKPIYDENKKLRTWIGLNTDITEKVKEHERKIEMEEQLRRAQKLESLSVLSAGMAHKFNNLLSVIVGSAEMLEIEYGNVKEINTGISRIKEAAQSAAGQVSQLLAFSRKQNLRGELLNIHQIIDDVASLTGSITNPNIIMRTEKEAKQVTVSGDGAMIKGAVTNLYLNALDSMDSGGVLIIKTENVTIGNEQSYAYSPEIKSGKFIKISVSDTGKGIHPDEMKKIFDPFYSGKSFGQTSGLGLSMVYGCVKAHSGAVSVESELEKGTIFNLFLPLYKEKDSGQIKGPRPKSKEKGKIMLVDDENMVVEISTRMLMTIGHEVVAFEDPEKSLDYYKQHHEEISLVILDSVMPEMSGSELLTKLKEINPEILSILCSGMTASVDHEANFGEGFGSIINKPFSLSELQSKIEKLLS
jgi:PAS domain S-box-containing protein